MAEWEKMGLIFNPSAFEDRPAWMHSFAQAPNVIIFDAFVRVYFCCRPKPDALGQFVSYCAFVDFDRMDLTRIVGLAQHPILPLGGLGMFDEFGTYPVSLARDGRDIIAYYGGWTRCESVPFNVSLGMARSHDDGVTFSKLGNGPVLGHAPDEPFVVTSPKIRRYGDKWFLGYTAGRKWFMDNGRAEIVYKIRMATSDDGVNWERLNRDIIPDQLGTDEAQACPDTIYRNGHYHMFFCYREATDFRSNKNRSYRIGYASSKDMLTWERDDTKAGIDISADGWDSGMVAYPTVFELDGTIYMIYLGNDVGRDGFGLAKLRGDLI
ncbi:MAG: hypothetical protein WC043_07970 [Pseudobdellovibrionaceae bacterium]